MNIIIFTGGNPPDTLDFMKIYRRIEQDDNLIIAADSGTDTLNRMSDSIKNHTFVQTENSTIQDNLLNSIQNDTIITPSYILGDMDSMQDKSLLNKFSNAEIMEYDSYKNFTDTELSLKKAYEINPEAKIFLIGGNGGRPDHFLGILETFCSEHHPSVWLCGPQVIYYISDGDTLTAQKLNPNDIISIARVCSGSTEGFVRTSGLEWGDDCMRKKGMPSISNRIRKTDTDSLVTVTACDAPFLVFLPYSADVKVRPKDK